MYNTRDINVTAVPDKMTTAKENRHTVKKKKRKENKVDYVD